MTKLSAYTASFAYANSHTKLRLAVPVIVIGSIDMVFCEHLRHVHSYLVAQAV